MEREISQEEARELLAALKELLRTGINGGNDVRLAYVAIGGRELGKHLLDLADASEKAVEAARVAIAKAEGREG